jgi:uncharacterized cupredoxin-like copper-binding protein
MFKSGEGMAGDGVRMETGPSAGEAIKAAPKRGALGIVIAIVIAVAATAAAMDLVVIPALQPTQTSYVKFHITAFDVGYDQPGFNPRLGVKAGQLILIEMNNSGAMDHEFLLFSGSKDTILASAKAALAQAQANNPGWNSDPAIATAALDNYTEYHDSWANLTRYGCNDPRLGCVDHDVGPDTSTLFWFVVNTPGTYFFACHQVDTTAIPWQIHQEKGMWGTLVVS